MPATIVLADHTGRLGNRLILYSHVIAAAEEYGCRVVNLSILAASHYFAGLHLNPWASYPRQTFPFDLRWLIRPFRTPIQNWVRGRRGKPPARNRWLTVLDMENRPTYRLDSPEFANLTRSSRWIVLWGYPFRCPNLLEKHAVKVREFFRFRRALAPEAGARLATARAAGKKTLCIHVRQDDVIREPWRYVEPWKYAQALQSFRQHHPETDWEVFVCSDSRIPLNLFPEDAVRGIPRPLSEDYGLMEGADALMGFDSTLSIFAAFASEKPFLRLRREDCSWREERRLCYDGV